MKNMNWVWVPISLISPLAALASDLCSGFPQQAQIIGHVTENSKTDAAGVCDVAIAFDSVQSSKVCPYSEPLPRKISIPVSSSGCPKKGYFISGVLQKSTQGKIVLDGDAYPNPAIEGIRAPEMTPPAKTGDPKTFSGSVKRLPSPAMGSEAETSSDHGTVGAEKAH